MGVGPGVHRAIGACTVTTRRGELAVRPESVEPQVFDNCIADATSSALPPGLQHRQPGRIMDAHKRAGRRAHLTPVMGQASCVMRPQPRHGSGVVGPRTGQGSGVSGQAWKLEQRPFRQDPVGCSQFVATAHLKNSNTDRMNKMNRIKKQLRHLVHLVHPVSFGS